MAPTPQVDDVEATHPGESTITMTPARVAPLGPLSADDVVELPASRPLAELLTEQLDAGVARMRGDRTVTRPADTHDLVRALAGTGDRLREYEDLFKALGKRVAAELSAELATAVGRDRNGAPRDNMDVPDDDGTTIKVTREWSTSHDIDRDQAVTANVALVAHEWKTRGVVVTPEAEQFAVAAVSSVVELLLPAAAQKVNITGLEALTALLGERELNDLAQVASDAYRSTTSKFTKAKVARVEPVKTPRARIPRKRTTAS